MAELLVVNSEPYKDDPWVWQKGDVCFVAEDGHEWGSEEGLPKFKRIKLPGVRVDELDSYMEEDKDQRRKVKVTEAALDAAKDNEATDKASLEAVTEVRSKTISIAEI